jgi:O-antigen/teichoic acid export membrane protein
MVSALISLATSVVLVRTLGAQLYGEYAMLMAFVTWGLLLAEAGGNAGLMRFLGTAEQAGARASLYTAVLTRRCLILTVLAVGLLYLGPIWAQWAGVAMGNWSRWIFLGVAMIVASSLIGQLAYHGLLGGFRHREALVISQASSIVRATAICATALIIPRVEWLVTAMLMAAVIEAIWFHNTLWKQIGLERSSLPTGLIHKAWRHGVITLFDKITSAIADGPFLLLALAAYSSSMDLAYLAVASELVKKFLSVAGLPAGNMVLPYLNQASHDEARLVGASSNIVRASVVLFFSTLGIVYVSLPSGLPLLYGEPFSHAVVLALILAPPVFIDAWGRFALVSALATRGDYRAIMSINSLQAVLSVMALLLTYDRGLVTILLVQGVIKVIPVCMLLWRCARLGLLAGVRAPYAFIITVLTAVMTGLFIGEGLSHGLSRGWRLSASVMTYMIILLLGLRLFRGFDADLVKISKQLAGRYVRWVDLLVPAKSLRG